MADKFFMEMNQEQLMAFRENIERRDIALREAEVTLMKHERDFWAMVRMVEIDFSQKIRELHSRSYIIQEKKD
jgi:hypothetical protein